jgi:hypothetical protein
MVRRLQKVWIESVQIAGLFNPLSAKLNPICHLLALLGAHPILYIGGVRVKYDRKIAKSDCYLHHIFRPSIRPHRTARLPLNGFS